MVSTCELPLLFATLSGFMAVPGLLSASAVDFSDNVVAVSSTLASLLLSCRILLFRLFRLLSLALKVSRSRRAASCNMMHLSL